MFLIMFPFFLFFGLFFLLISFMFLSLNFSLFIQWNFFCFSYNIVFPFYFDYLSCIFMSMVLLISGSIIFYSEFYMMNENFKSRFFFLMFLFVISMVFLILSPNFFCMLLGWDGLGLISFCLVMYYQNFKSLVSALITALTNRVGDVFIIGTISMFFSMGSWSYMNFYYCYNLYWVSLLFFLASLTKSAQIPFSAWLPAAMAAPTPVSSLVHSSTLVTAGIYILIRFYYFLPFDLKNLLMFVSLLTMIMSGISGVLEYDLKKIIALSTLSQLGFMMFTISLGYCDLAFFHLICHASFKALLFMCAGLFIHNFLDNQDIRLFGLLDKNYFFSLCMFNVANLSLCGFPFLSGFFSKDLILELCLVTDLGVIYLFLLLFGTLLTVFYSIRLFIFLCFKKLFSFSLLTMNMKNMKIHFSMFLLFFFSLVLGFFGSNLVLLPYNYIILPLNLKVLILMICLLSFSLCFFFSKNYFSKISNWIFFFSQMWFMNFLKTDFFKNFLFFNSKKIVSVVYSIIEDFFGLMFIKILLYFSWLLNKFFKKNFVHLFIMLLFFLLMYLMISV